MIAKTDSTDATLTEYLTAVETDNSIEDPAAVKYIPVGHTWVADDAETLDDNPNVYHSECCCGETFGSWGSATLHVKNEH